MRPEKDTYYLDIALAVSKRSTCLRRRYGAVIVKDDVIVATGYNGSPRGELNCCDEGMCPRADQPHNSGDYSECNAVHAEQNAMICASRSDMIGATLYLACEEYTNSTGKWVEIKQPSPCQICFNMLRNTGIKQIINREGIAWDF